MGRLSKEVLGLIRGKVGNVIFRVRHNTTYAYKIPEKVNISQSPEAKTARGKFTPLSRFQSFINSIPELKYFWKRANIKGISAFHKIGKYNYQFLLNNRPGIKNEITPMFADSMGSSPVRMAYLDKSGIRMEAKYEKGWYVQLKKETFIYALVVICFYNPANRKKEFFTLDKLEEDNFEVIIEKEFEIKVPFTESALNNYYIYRNSIIYVTFITRDAEGNPVRYNTNYKQEFTHEYTEEEKIYIGKLQEVKLNERIQESYKGYLKKIFTGRRKE
jgi:hypothetical protein